MVESATGFSDSALHVPTENRQTAAINHVDTDLDAAPGAPIPLILERSN
jgi:hypothetical protein